MPVSRSLVLRLLSHPTLCATLLLSVGVSSGCDAPDPTVPPDFDLQGHRGARGILPENTIPAFIEAAGLGVTTLELDVVISRDSQVVVSHEPWMSSRICLDPEGYPAPEDREATNLYTLTADDIARYDCGSQGHPDYPEQRPVPVSKPLLAAVLDTIEARFPGDDRARLHYNIETKSNPEADGVFHPDPQTFARLLYAEIDRAGLHDRVVVQSFDVRTLQAMRRLDPEVRLALLVAGDENPEAKLAALGFSPEILSPNYRLVDAALVRRAGEAGMAVVPWTVNEPETMRMMLALGVDGLITDYPNRFVHAFGLPGEVR